MDFSPLPRSSCRSLPLISSKFHSRVGSFAGKDKVDSVVSHTN
jgi:hypothetical protein